MTELGHGSNVAALQTECVLDTTTDEWIVNTPDDSAIKWYAFCSLSLLLTPPGVCPRKTVYLRCVIRSVPTLQAATSRSQARSCHLSKEPSAAAEHANAIALHPVQAR